MEIKKGKLKLNKRRVIVLIVLALIKQKSYMNTNLLLNGLLLLALTRRGARLLV